MGTSNIGLSALKNSSNALSATANNIANSETTGFKRKATGFANLMAGSEFGAGVAISSVNTQFVQGGRNSTGRVLDTMIDGSGFFMVSEPTSATLSYTRNGAFNLDKDGFMTTESGARVQGYEANAAGQYPLNASDVVIPRSYNTPEVTLNASLDMNLKAGGSSFSTSIAAFDSLGNENNVDMDFAPTGPNAWDVSYAVDGNSYGPFPITFSATGQIVGAPLHAVNVPGFSNGAAAQNITFDLTAMTQFAGSNKVNSIESDGFGIGSLESLSVGSDGVISARYSNGQTLNNFKLGIATFPNTEGLSDVGGGKYLASQTSGDASLSYPGESGSGAIVSSALEGSNVDLTGELVDLIKYQKFFRSASKIITTDNELNDTALQMVR